MVNEGKNWAYSQTVREHFFNPRNVLGNENDAKDASGVGTVGSPACGDVMRIWIWIKDNKIIACKWQTFGCASAIASTSILSEIVQNMDLEEALKIKPADIVGSLDGLPNNKIHCSVLGDQALRASIYDYYKKSGQREKIPNDQIMCACKNLLRSDIEAAYAEGANTFEKIQEKTGASTICGKCEQKIKDFIKTLEH